MSRLLAASVLALTLAANTTAQAQSYTAPAGIPAAAAPGGASVSEPSRAWTGGAAIASDRLTTGSVTRNGRGAARR
ncbi:hypothetical protein [Methylobacterium pseudosasicola]|uniref:Uncharacterized protein n=1 Tax=Methylobacterium pseudosasicola TaxID=582667 RepID=A0A1I4PZT7_9HYPH|nr:hypothetical protein [Methylobacterium pseudosasicola]SFM32923.1 hypothetical protein SAMN05192568_102738 [Methylobacterium pseudosasicola]